MERWNLTVLCPSVLTFRPWWDEIRNNMTPVEIFLRGVWTFVPDEEDTSWVKNVAQQPSNNGPLGDYGAIIRRMLQAGVSVQDIARLSRITGYETAHDILYHLDDPNFSYEGFPEGEHRLFWRLEAFDDETEEPIGPLIGLHESFLSMDPNGREMRPRPSRSGA
jgi:hypothetical protein